MTVTEAVVALAADSGRPEAACRAALRDLLLISSVPEQDRAQVEGASSRSFFAFKLHQFISGAGHAYSTLEPAGQRMARSSAGVAARIGAARSVPQSR